MDGVIPEDDNEEITYSVLKDTGLSTITHPKGKKSKSNIDSIRHTRKVPKRSTRANYK